MDALEGLKCAMGSKARLGMRKQPISPVTEPLQFRAIGLVRGIYRPTDPNVLTTGMIQAMDHTPLEAVLLGRMIPLVRRYVDLRQPHLWVCYPRNRDKEQSPLHLQVMGIWEPSLLDRSDEPPQEEGQAPEEVEPELSDGYFSVRGELILTDPETGRLLVKIQQQRRVNTPKRPRSFKLRLHGVVPPTALHHFLNLHLKRHGQSLHVERYEVIQFMPRRRTGRGRGRTTNSRRPVGRSGFSRRPAHPRQGLLRRTGPGT